MVERTVVRCRKILCMQDGEEICGGMCDFVTEASGRQFIDNEELSGFGPFKMNEDLTRWTFRDGRVIEVEMLEFPDGTRTPA